MLAQQASGRTCKPAVLIALLVISGWADGGFAVLIAGDSFDYAVGTELSSGNLNGGIGWASAWVGTGTNIGTADQVEASDIAPPTGYLGAIGNQLILDTDSPTFNIAVNAQRELAQAIDMSPSVEQTYYFSILLRRDDGFNGGGSENSRYFELWESGGTLPLMTGGTTSDEATAVSFNGWPLTASANGVGSLGEVPLGTDLLAVVKFILRPSGQNDEIYMTYLQDGANLSSEPASWMASTAYDMDGSATIFQIVNARFNDQQRYDEIRLGTTFADVVSGHVTHPGDANGDGMVNLADLQILGDNWQSTNATWAEADFTGDGAVNLADLQILGDNWGYGTGADISLDEAFALVSIPEPAGFSLLLLLSSGLLFARHER
ncbi:MAG: hypothetical protein IT445_00325 [Phycisphaeraceae bacterium]|nr:hypothetical protein [Phycisphaeraceae bacterium]